MTTAVNPVLPFVTVGNRHVTPGDHYDRNQIRETADIVEVVESYGVRLRKSGQELVGRCPLHDDKTPSFSVSPVKQLWHCHGCGSGGSVIDFVMAKERIDFKGALKLLASCSGVDIPSHRRDCIRTTEHFRWDSRQQPATTPRRIVAKYDYTDEHGELLYQVVRYQPKNFRQRRPDGHGGWIWKKGERQVLYHLPEVLEAPIVFVTEGEKDVETLREHGFVATTNAGGANAPWLPEYTETLKGREVILIPDNDQPGWERVVVIARALLGRAARIFILNDIHTNGAKDITEWFECGHGECELIALLEGPDAA